MIEANKNKNQSTFKVDPDQSPTTFKLLPYFLGQALNMYESSAIQVIEMISDAGLIQIQNRTLRYDTLRNVTKNTKKPPIEQKPIDASASQPKQVLACEQLVEIWNKHAAPSLPRVRELGANTARAKKAAARWKENNNVEHWINIITELNKSNFLTGKEKDWKATFDFLIKPDTANKILEGNYKNKAEGFLNNMKRTKL